MAIEESNPAVHQLGEVPSADATSAPVARPLDLRPGRHFPSPRPRLALPHREMWGDRRRHRTDDTPAEHTVQHLVNLLRAEHYITDVQARLDAAERAS